MTDQEYINKLKDALVLIKDVCLDYDGYRTVDGLKSLIDEVSDIAREALQSKKMDSTDMSKYINADKIEWHTLYFNGGKQEITYKDEVDALPTADVAPIIHAHWIKNKGYMLSRCSACQNTIPLGREYKHKYCPNCGAKMDEEEQDATL